MKVLFVSNDPSIFNPESPARARMREYAAALGELHIVSCGSRDARESHEAHLHLYPIRGPKILSLIRLPSVAHALIEKHRISVVSAQDPFEYGFAALIAACGTGAKTHVQVHIDFLAPEFAQESFLNRTRLMLADYVLPHADSVRVVSKRIKDALAKRYGSYVQKIAVVPITVPELPEAAPLPPHPFSFALVTMARLEKEKRIEDVLAALTECDPSVGLFVIGEGRERARLEALARTPKLAGRVVFLGWRTDALSLMQGADAYIQASAYEGYGRTLIEAALAGLPIITTDVGVVGEALHDGISALVALPHDIKKLADHIRALSGDPELGARLGKAARKTARAGQKDALSPSQAVTADLRAAGTRRLLIVTQVLDRNDLYLGFFHRWAEELAPRFARIEVICLKEGEHALPRNVRVHSLGKERATTAMIYHSGLRRLRYAFRFLALVRKLRNEYDAAFVHMNQEYVLLAGWLWRVLGKRVYLWRNHYAGSYLTRLAGKFSEAVFYTSAHSYTARFKNAIRMPVGVDTERFFPDASVARAPRSILFFGRMTESKRPGLVIDALALLAKRNIAFSASFVGSTPPGEEHYIAALKQRVADAGLSDRIAFSPGIPNERAVSAYRVHDIYVNAGRSGMLDKTIFEAAASGCRVLAASDDWRKSAGEAAWFADSSMLAERLYELLAAPRRDDAEAGELASCESLRALCARLAEELGVS